MVSTKYENPYRTCSLGTTAWMQEIEQRMEQLPRTK